MTAQPSRLPQPVERLSSDPFASFEAALNRYFEAEEQALIAAARMANDARKRHGYDPNLIDLPPIVGIE